MRSFKDCQQLVEQLLADKNTKFTDPHQKIAWERGYLASLLATIIKEDNILYRNIKRQLK
jgi:hypothetical protein